MSKIIEITKVPKYRFSPDILKFPNEKGDLEQHIIIVLRRNDCPYPVISPATSLLDCWIGRKASTRYKYAQCICGFLNYAYFEKRICCFEEIDTAMVVDYLNYLGRLHARDYVRESMRLLKYCFFHVIQSYDNLLNITSSDIYVDLDKDKSAILWPELDAKVLIPSKTENLKEKNKLTNLDNDIVMRFMNLAILHTPRLAFGFYLMFFGGLRVAEVCELTDADVPSRIDKKTSFYVNLKDEVLNVDSKYADLYQNKRNRKQAILMIPELFDVVYTIYKKQRNGSNPIMMNRKGESITERGVFGQFIKVKKLLIDELERSDDVYSKLKAFELKSFDWATHVGRGFYSNLLATHSVNPFNVAVGRGDNTFGSALPYLAESEQTSKQIEDILSKVYEKGRKNREKGSEL